MKSILSRPISRVIACLTAVSMLALTAGCQSPGTNTASLTNSAALATIQKGSVRVSLTNSTFQPAAIHVAVGTKVTWRNDDSMKHTVTSGSNGQSDGVFDSKDLANGQTFSYTFNKPGTFPYYCVYHPNMIGTVIVSDSSDGSDNMTGMDMGSGSNSTSNATGTSPGASSTNNTVAPVGTGTAGEPQGADDIRLLPYQMVGGLKVFHLTAQPVMWQVKPGQKVEAWAFNGSVPGPEIKVDQGDKVKIVVDNKLAEGTTVHWHGLDVPFSQDGTGGISQPDIKPGQSWTYTFTVGAPAGTYMYHSHPMTDMLKQEQMGLWGPFIVEPKGTGWRQVHPGYQDEYTVMVNDSPQFGYTINGLSYPATPVLPAKVGDKVLVHLINIGSMEHPMHLHGMHFQVIGQDGYPIAQPQTLDTIATAPGSTYDLSFVADQPGKWLFHCHITDHVTDSNGQMSGMITMFDVK